MNRTLSHFAAAMRGTLHGDQLGAWLGPRIAGVMLRPMQVENAKDDRIDACTTTVHAGITEAA